MYSSYTAASFARKHDLASVSARDVIFARNDDVAIVRNGLEYAEMVHADTYNSVIMSKGLPTIPA
jgi:hypothetical protein